MIDNNELLNLKLKLLNRFYSNCEKQISVLDKNLVNELVNILNEQDDIINQLKKIDGQTSDVFTNKEIEQKLKDIKKIQETIMEKVKNAKQELSIKFKQINTGKKAIYGGYIKAEPMNNGYFIDKKIGKWGD